MRNKNLCKALIISFFYVLLGTIAVMVSFPDYSIMGFDYNSPLWLPLVILTIPVNILLFGLVIVDISFIAIFILQSIVFLITWRVVYKLLNFMNQRKYPKRS